MSERIQVEPESSNPRVRVRCGGDLLVEGWEQALIEVDGHGSQPVVEAEPEQLEIATDSSCTVRLPQTSELVESAAGGLVKVSNVRGGVEIEQAGGDLLVEDTGSVRIGSAGGRVNLANTAGGVEVTKRTHGDLTAEQIGGAISISEVGGRLTLQNVSAVRVRRARADVDVLNAGGNAVVDRADGAVEFINVDGAAAVGKAMGRVSLRGVRGKVACDQVNGELHLAEVGEAAVSRVMGDLTVETVRGALSCKKANGRATLREVGGSVSLGGVGGDLVVEGCGGSLSAKCGGSVDLATVRGNVNVAAGGDVRCRLDEAEGGSFKAVCGGGLTVEGGATMVARGPGAHTFRAGAGKSSYSLVAGGSVHLESGGILKGLGEEEGVRGARHAARAQRHITRSLSKTLRRKLRAAGKRAAEGGWEDARSWSFSFDTDAPSSGASVRDEEPPADFEDIDVEVAVENEADVEPVSEEERLAVLRMLSKGKITAAEAEELLDALGSRGS
ncbi:MAG: hypothetical protein OXH73_01175 [Caldilineaceae bacterium]|nr:hypothetical protein [Caldilineaceae bacterium]